MKTFKKYIVAAALALATMAPNAHAAPLSPAQSATPSANGLVILAGGSQHYGSRQNQTRLHIRGGKRYYNGHRGYRQSRRGYRQHRGYWYPRSAFSFQLYVAPRVHRPRYVQPRYSHASRHISWCASRYRTYRVSDNTYIPRVGHRAHCRSPYRR